MKPEKTTGRQAPVPVIAGFLLLVLLTALAVPLRAAAQPGEPVNLVLTGAEGLAGELNGEQKKQLGMVKSSSEHLLTLITDSIDLSKIEAGKIDLSQESFELARALRRALHGKP